MTAFRFCCFCSSKDFRSKPQGGSEQDEVISPPGSSGGLCAFQTSEGQECPVGEGDLDRLVVEHKGAALGSASQNRSIAASEPSMCGRPEHKRRFVFVSGTQRESSSSLTEPLMDSCSTKEEDGPLTYGEESYTIGESSRWDCSSYHKTETSEEHVHRSRFINMDSGSISEFDNSLVFHESSLVKEMEHSGLESVSMSSGWLSNQESQTTSHDTSPVTWFLQNRNQGRFGSIVSTSSDSSKSVALRHGGQATELQDAISFALRDEKGPAENSSKMGTNILAALRDMKASRCVSADDFHRQPCRPGQKMFVCNSQPNKAVVFREGSPGKKDCDASVRQEIKSLCVGQEDDVVTWFGNPIQTDLVEEDRGTSVGTSIILPVQWHEDEEESINVLAPGTVDECSAIGKDLLLLLEDTKLRGASLKSESVPSGSTKPHGVPHKTAAEMPENTCKMQVICRSSSSSSLASCQESKSGSSCGDCEPVSREVEGIGYETITTLPGNRDQTDADILFDTACSTPDDGKKGVHDSAITVRSCRRGITGCSSVSQLSDQQGTSWVSSDVTGSIGLPPSLPSFSGERAKKVAEHSEGAVPEFCVKDLSLGAFDSSSFYDCLPDVSSSETGVTSLNPKVGAYSLPELNLSRAGSSGWPTHNSDDSLSAFTRSWPGIPEMTPRSLERWQLDLKLIWMGEDDDDLVAEVRNGSSCVFNSPKMPPVPEEEETEEAGDYRSPINSPVNSPVPSPNSDCEAASLSNEPDKIALAKDVTDVEKAEQLEGAEGENKEQSGDAIDVVDRMLLQLKGTTPRSGTSRAINDKDGSHLAKSALQSGHTEMSPTALKAAASWSINSRKKAILSGVKAQLEKLGTLVASNAATTSAKCHQRESTQRIELECAILQNVWNEVTRLEKELINGSSPRRCGTQCVQSEQLHYGQLQDNPDTVSTVGRESAKCRRSATSHSALKNKRAKAHVSGGLPSPDDIFNRRKVRRRVRPNPRAAGLLHGREGVWHHLGDKGYGRRGSRQSRSATAAERKALIEGLRVAQELLSERVQKLGPAEPSPRESGTGNESKISDTPKLHSSPPDLCRKGRIFGAASDEACMVQAGNRADTQGTSLEQLLAALKTSSINQVKSFTVNKGVGGGRIRRIFLTL